MEITEREEAELKGRLGTINAYLRMLLYTLGIMTLVRLFLTSELWGDQTGWIGVIIGTVLLIYVFVRSFMQGGKNG